MIPLLCIVGPTASGKTALSIALAKHIGGEIVSADSMQIYRDMDIATAKPTIQEMEGIPHHLISVLPMGRRCSVAEYTDMARDAIGDIATRGKLPILVGGTGLYISSIVDNIVYSPIQADYALREELEKLAQVKGNQAVFEILQECDEETAKKLHPNNLGRVIRAIEVYKTSGKTIGEHDRISRSQPSPYDCLQIGLNFLDRQKLYDRIDLRVEHMMAVGLLQEAERVRAAGLGPTASQAIGYKELGEYLDGNCTLEQAVELLKRETRHYAKRQLTWFRRDSRINWLYCDENTPDSLLAAALALYAKHYGEKK